MSSSVSATLGSGTPSARPISRARPRSFWIMSTLNRASAGMPRTNGPRYLTIGEAMTDISSAALCDRSAQLARHVGAHRAHLGPDGARPEPCDHAVRSERDRAQRGAVRDHAENRVGGLGDGARRLLEHETGGDQGASLLRGPVVADDLAPGGEEPLRHAATHRAEPDETERRHQPLPSSTTAIALISSLHRAWVAR